MDGLPPPRCPKSVGPRGRSGFTASALPEDMRRAAQSHWRLHEVRQHAEDNSMRHAESYGA